MLEVTYRLTRAEYVEMAYRYHVSVRAGRKAVLIDRLRIGLLVILLLKLVEVYGLDWIIAGYATAYLAARIYEPISLRHSYGRIYDKHAARNPGDTTIRLEESGLFVERPYSRTAVDWNAVDELDQDEQGLYIHYPYQQVALIPRRAFVDEEQAKAFWTLLLSYRRHAETATKSK